MEVDKQSMNSDEIEAEIYAHIGASTNQQAYGSSAFGGPFSGGAHTRPENWLQNDKQNQINQE